MGETFQLPPWPMDEVILRVTSSFEEEIPALLTLGSPGGASIIADKSGHRFSLGYVRPGKTRIEIVSGAKPQHIEVIAVAGEKAIATLPK